MREILFRGKSIYADSPNDISTNYWTEGSLVRQTEHYGIPVGVYHIVKLGDFHCDYYDSEEVWPETVGQYTGLKDKNGMKIFEGDIIKTRHGIRYITFEDGCFGARRNNHLFANLRNYNRELDGCWEVIGNIHDNPELLENERSKIND